MSSMTDLVFLLLIFFIILSTLVSPPGVKVDLPSGKVNGKPLTKPVAVSIDQNEIHYIDKKPVDVAELEAALKQRLGEAEEGSKQSIILNVDKTVPTGTTTNIFVLARRNQWKIAIATTGK